ncbi:MAG: wax ester/triacylglycerol synthase family O-acyltransferase [Gammaproteobacteria bacterium]|nr:wax ester/triacylglycerol synthase family O-acyltransferase [Gammaproteobacteria bacterium]
MKQLNPQDATFLYMESEHNHNHVTSVHIYDPGTRAHGDAARFRELVDHVASRLQYSPFLTQRLVRLPLEMDFPYWVDDDHFDIEYHVREGRLPVNADWSTFCDQVARYHSRPLNPHRPLWDMYVLEGLDSIEGMPEGCYAILTKVHHAAVDGAAMIRFFGIMHDIDALGTPVLPLMPSPVEHHYRPNTKEVIKRTLVSNLRSPVRIADTVMRLAPGLYQAVQKKFSKSASADEKLVVPITRFNRDVSPHKNFDATRFPLADLKAIRLAVKGATINDVVLAICSGGLRTYLKKHNELPAESLVAWVPINTRSKNDDAADGNNISAMTAPIFTQIEEPISRLRSIYQATQQSKEAKSGVSAKLMTDLSKHIPAATQLMASKLLLQNNSKLRMCNLFVSNVPGPQQAYYMQGAKVIATYGLTPISDGMGLFINTPSYDGNIMFNIVSTREIMPDIRFFIECLESSMVDLKQAAAAELKKAAAAASPNAACITDDYCTDYHKQ